MRYFKFARIEDIRLMTEKVGRMGFARDNNLSFEVLNNYGPCIWNEISDAEIGDKVLAIIMMYKCGKNIHEDGTGNRVGLVLNYSSLVLKIEQDIIDKEEGKLIQIAASEIGRELTEEVMHL